MVADDLPADVLNFLCSCIDSVEQLNVILLMHANPQRHWTVSELSTELRSTPASIELRLDNLYDRNVFIRPDKTENASISHHFNPSSPEMRTLLMRLAEQNLLRPYRVIDAIYSQPNKSLQAFADAFNLRGDKP